MPDINQVDIGKNLDEIVPKMLHFLRAETNKTRKGNAGVATKNMTKILQKFDMQQSTKSLRRITMILCLGERMQQDMTKLFIFFEVQYQFSVFYHQYNAHEIIRLQSLLLLSVVHV